MSTSGLGLPDQAPRRESLSRAAATLISGSAISQLILFLCSPLISRLFTAEEFGRFSNYSAWVTVLALIGTLRYEHAIIVAEDHLETWRVLALAFVLGVAATLALSLFSVSLWVLNPDIPYIESVRGLLVAVPLGVGVICFSSPLLQLNTKMGRFKRVAVIATVQSLATVGAQLLLGRTRVNGGLIAGSMIGTIIAASILGYLALDKNRLAELLAHGRLTELRRTARQFAAFPKYTLPADLLATLSQTFVPVLILALFSPAAAGLFAFATRVVRVPTLVVSAAAASALRRGAPALAAHPDQLQRLLFRTVLLLTAVAVLPFAVLAVWGDVLFAFVFGAQWRVAGEMVQRLSPALLLEFVVSPLAVFFLVAKAQRSMLWIQSASVVALAAALMLGRSYSSNILDTSGFLSAALAFTYLLMLGAAIRAVRLRTDSSRLERSPH